MIRVTCPEFQPGERIPTKYTGEGDDVSPPLAWSDRPSGTAELALICDDPDAPVAQPWVHWVVYKIPGDAEGFPEGSAPGTLQGANDFGNTGYGGPMPPPGHGTHRYYFRVYALKEALDLNSPGASKEDVLSAMEGKILDQGELVGTYSR